MKTVLEQYFPLFRTHSYRVKRWEKISSYRTAQSRHGKLLSVTSFDLETANPDICGKKLAFISDIHWNNDGKSRRIIDEAAEILSIEKPDYLLLGGDQSGNADTLSTLPSALKKLSSCVPLTVAVNGNWESGKDWLDQDFWAGLCREASVIHLCNQSYSDSFFTFLGVDDVCRGKVYLPESDGKKFEILLSHSPDGVIAADSGDDLKNIRLALCGHNHGGQIRLPFIGALRVPSRYRRRFCCGVFRHKRLDLTMIVGTGINELSFPLRWNCRREILMVRFSCREKLG